MNSKVEKLNWKNLSRVALLFTLYSFAFGINLPDSFIPKFIFLFIFSFFLYSIFSFSDSWVFKKENLPLYFSIAIYLWSVITYLYSDNKEEALNRLEARLVFIILPLLINFSKKIKPNIKFLMLSYLLGCYLSLFICLFYLFDKGIIGINPMRNSASISNVINSYKHYNYLGINLSVGLVFILYLVKDKRWYSQLSILLPSVFLFMYFVYISQARLSFILICLSTIFIFGYWVYSMKSYFFKWVIISISIFFVSVFVWRLTNSFLMEGFLVENVIDSERFYLWSQAIELIKEKPLFGHGIGDVPLNYEAIESNNLNAHNQFLEFWLEGGLVSLILFSFLLYYVFLHRTKKNRDVFSLVYLILLLTASMVEAILNRISGISLFFFLFVLLYYDKKEESVSLISKVNYIIYTFSFVVLSLSIYLIFNTVRNSNFNPENPKTFASGPFTQVKYKDLPGVLPPELSETTAGYMLDKRSYFDIWENNLYSFTLIPSPKHSENDSIYASVFCYVSADFNGDWVKISANGTNPRNASYYNLEKKAKWQKLEISPKVNNENVPIYLYFSKHETNQKDSIKGSVIFAYPYIEVYKK